LGGGAGSQQGAQQTMTSTNPNVSIATTTAGFITWGLGAPVADNTQGTIKVAEAQAGSGPNTNTTGGSVILITFVVKNNAPAGQTPIYVATTFGGLPTKFTITNGPPGGTYQMPPRPQLSQPTPPVGNVPYPGPFFVPFVDGAVTIGPYFGIAGTPSTISQGTPFTVTVTAFTANNTVNTSYSGTVLMSSSDPSAAFVPPSATLTNGVGTFTVTLQTLGSQTLTATDAPTGTITGTSNPILVTTVGAQDHYVFSAPGNATAGSQFTFTVTAETQANTIDTGYTGTAHFTSSDPLVSAGNGLPSDATFVNGQGIFTATLKTSGSQTLSATDTTTAAITANTTITVSPAPASHFVVNAAAATVAGNNMLFTVVAEDQFNNTATGFAGNATFSSTDTGAATKLPAASPLVSGVGNFSATLTTAGNQTITATQGTVSGTSNTIAVSAAAATHFVVTAQSATVAGNNLLFTVVAEDQFNNTATGYTGTATFTSTDTGASTKLPAPSPLAAGVGTFSATLTTAGSQTLTATDAPNSLAGTSNTITVNAAAASHFTVSAPTTTVASSNLTFTVVAEDKFNNTATGYTGTATFSSTDTGASTKLPAPSPLAAGVGTLSATLTTAGNQAITATDGTITGTSNSISVTTTVQPATHFLVNAPGSATAGAPFTFTVTAETAGNTTATSYAGTVTFSSTDTGASTLVPTPSTLVAGVGTFSATLTTKGGQTLTGTDGTITGSSGTITVSAAAASHFAVSAQAATVAGSSMLFTVVAEDQFNNTATGYTGTATFTSTDTGASTKLPAPSPLLAGVGTFSATLTTAGNQTITATDAPNSVTGTSSTVTVSPTVASHFVVSAPATTVAGNNLTFTVVAEDQFNNTATSYTGTATFSSTDTGASTKLPAPSPPSAGVATFSATLTTAGNQTITATDAPNSVSGTSSAIVVSAAPATHFVVSAPATTVAGNNLTFTVAAEDKFNNTATSYTGTATFSTTDTGASTKLPAPSPLPAGVGTFSATLTTAGTQTITATDAPNTLSGSSGAITVSAAPASHFVVSAPATTVAGNNLTFTVAAEDKFNNAATGYTGTATFSTTDTGASTVLPGPSPLSAGLGTFSATLTTAGTQTLTATDAANTVTGTSGTATVSAAPATHFGVSAPLAAGPGSSFTFTVTAEDQFNNTNTGYSGTVVFSSSDTLATVPGSSTLTSGAGTFSATLQSLGNQTLTAADMAQPTITGTAVINVNSSQATHFVIGISANVTAGTAFTFTVTAETASNVPALAYNGNVTISGGGAGAVLPASSTLSNGVGTFSATLTTAGNQTLTAADTVNTSITAGTGTIAVSPAGAVRFVVMNQSTATAGSAFVEVVTAYDSFNNIATGYNGTVHFTSSDTQVGAGSGLPIDGPLFNLPTSSGIGYFAILLKTAGTQTVTVQDQSDTTLTGTSNPIAVSAAAASHFVVTPVLPTYPGAVPGPTTFASTGQSFGFTVSALDPYGNLAPTYAGTVQFSSSDTTAGVVLPPNSTLTSGVATFSASLRTPGTQTLTATDTVQNSGPTAITGASSLFAVRGLVVTSFTTTPTGFTATFNKPFQPNTVNLYTASALPDDVILTTSGTQVSIRGSVLFNSATSPTSMTFVKTTLVSSLGTFNPGNGLLAAGNYTATLRSFSAGSSGFQDALGSMLDGNNSGNPGANFVFTFSVSAPPVAVGIPDFARGPSNTDALFLPSTIGNGNTFNLIYTNPNTAPTTGTATVTYSTIAATLQANIQSALNALPQIGTGIGNVPNAAVVINNPLTIAAQGANVLVTFQNSYFVTATSQVLSSTTPGVTIALASINAANNEAGNGIPVALSSGLSVTSGSFTLQYDPTLLTISNAVSKIAGASFTLVSNTVSGHSGTAVLSLSSPSSISSTTTAITLGSLLATVPLSAASSYGAKQLLHFSSEQLNGTAGAIPVTNQDGVQVAAYLGDVTDTGGPFSLQDATGISAVAGGIASPVAQTIPGFAVFPNLDPAIIGGVSLAGAVSFGDASLMNQQLVSAQAKIPYAPIGLPITTVGPDPTLSVPTDLVAAPGGTVIVPVNIDTARPQGSSGMVDAILALTYDPNVFDVSATDVQLGTVPGGGGGWKVQAEVNAQTGLIGIELYSNTPILSTVGGSLVTIAMHVRETAPMGTTGLTLVPDVDPTGGVRVYLTQVSDAQGAFVLHQALTPLGMEPGEPGQLTITGQGPAVSGQPVLFGSQLESVPVSGPAGRTSSFEVQQTAASVIGTANSSALALDFIEQVFGDFGKAGQIVQDGELVQPGPLLNWDSSDTAPRGVRDLALMQGAAVAEQRDWVGESCLLGSDAALLDGATSGLDDGADIAGLEFFFAREAAVCGRSRMR